MNNGLSQVSKAAIFGAVLIGILVCSGCSNEKGLDRVYSADNAFFKGLKKIPEEVTKEELEMFQSYFASAFGGALSDFQIHNSTERHDKLQGKTIREIMLMDIAEREADISSELSVLEELRKLSADITALNIDPERFYSGAQDACVATVKVQNNSSFNINSFIVRGDSSIDGAVSTIRYPYIDVVNRDLVNSEKPLMPGASVEWTTPCNLDIKNGAEVTTLKELPSFNTTANLRLQLISIPERRGSVVEASDATIDKIKKQLDKLRSDRATLSIK